MGFAAAGGPADRGGRIFQVEQCGDGVGLFGGGQAVPDQAGHGHRPDGGFGGGQVGADHAEQENSGRCGGGLAAVSVDGDVGDLLGPVVAGDLVGRDDDQRDQHSDLGHGRGQGGQVAAGVADVVRVLGHLQGEEFDDLPQHHRAIAGALLGVGLVGLVGVFGLVGAFDDHAGVLSLGWVRRW